MTIAEQAENHAATPENLVILRNHARAFQEGTILQSARRIISPAQLDDLYKRRDLMP